MSVHRKGPCSWLVRVRVRSFGSVLYRQKVVQGKEQDARKVETAFFDELARGSKTSSLKFRNFGEVVTYWRENTQAKTDRIASLLNKLIRDMGAVPLQQLNERFLKYLKLLEEERSQRTGDLLANSTKNRLLMYAKVALNFCVKHELIEKNPLKYIGFLEEAGRERVLSAEETDRIMDVMRRENSYLYWPFYFSIKNPIRRGDIAKLTRKNLDWFKPWVHFQPSKTRKKKPRETCLIFLDEQLMNYFKSLPADCDLLFPRIDKDGTCHPLGDFKRHWYGILDAARVEDFHWHDTKHCAITWMLDNGYTELDLKNLGIQYSGKMIEVYYHHDAEKVLRKMQTQGQPQVVALPVALQAEKTVKFA